MVLVQGLRPYFDSPPGHWKPVMEQQQPTAVRLRQRFGAGDDHAPDGHEFGDLSNFALYSRLFIFD